MPSIRRKNKMRNKKSKKKKTTKNSKKKKKEILIVAKQNKMGLRLARRAERLLKDKADIQLDRSTAIRLRKRGHSIRKFSGDLIITIGGDGTFLWTAHKTDVPILPIKIEGYGFLCTTTFKEFEKNIPLLLKGKYDIIERIRLACYKIPTGKLEKYIGKIRHKDYPLSINEIAFARRRPSKILRVSFKIDNAIFDVVGDGVMFSTPSGSTAYSTSAGGPMVDPKLNIISVVPLYPFFSKAKPMVIPDDKKIEVDVKGGDCALVIDGHGGDYIKSGARFIIEKAKPSKVIVFEEKNFYEKVRRDLLE